MYTRVDSFLDSWMFRIIDIKNDNLDAQLCVWYFICASIQKISPQSDDDFMIKIKNGYLALQAALAVKGAQG